MELGFLCVLLTFVCGTLADLGPPVTVARCRVNCLLVTLKRYNGISDDVCMNKDSCRTCWNLCPSMIYSYSAWSILCESPNCKKGCNAACQFRKPAPKVPPDAGVKWHFEPKPFVQVYQNTQLLHFFWEKPVAETPQKGKIPFVYILFVREQHQQNSQWREVKQTASTTLEVDLDDLPTMPTFWLMAVNKNGTRTAEIIDKNFDPIEDVITTKVNVDHRSPSLKFSLNATVRMDTQKDGTFVSTIEWQQPPNLVGENTYVVNYFMDECGIYNDSPRCDIPGGHYADTVTVDSNKQAFYKIPENLYNARYMVLVELETTTGKIDDKVVFKTIRCPNVDESTFEVCLDLISTPNTTAISQSASAETHLVTEETENIDSGLNIHIVESMYVKNVNQVSVTFNWTTPLNHSSIEKYIVRYSLEDMEDGSDSQEITTKKTTITLTFKPNQNYIIYVDAMYRRNIGGSDRYSSEMRFNTSGISAMPVTGESRIHIYHKDKHWKNLNKIIVAATCIAIVIMIGLIVLFIYKKRQSFKNIIITKTAVAKSNSYKSNVGCKVDYSNQLLMMSDEWELDPCLLKFSSPIGQGAFGKVVTGYYKDSRVAIKLVRDSAPLSYKEDLLAEINLMKRIGSHPNIVSMIGACTLTEPIALIMEYVPYGNLQNFLKKCRQEGDFQKRMGRPSEVTYSIMDEHGGLDSGVITPADMLSFARQIAMAMEYLSAKKYVHRDLAARNILLDYGKVVKVCDFGLSRDIYNDNQYHKVTSGKLPLKWMAIESLRDRIFTTQSDVWSFGILFWEIVTMGGSPYTNIALADLYYVLANGYRMEKPSNCSNELYGIVRQCWMENPLDRPNFTQIREQIEQLLSRDRDYLELDNIDVPLSTSESSSLPKSEGENMSFLTGRRSPQPIKSVTINLPPQGSNNTNVCIEKSTEWLIRGRDDESTS